MRPARPWCETLLPRGVDLGYDGWMHDFGEYTLRSSRFSDGRRGDEVHNAFPVLSAKAAHDFFERVAADDVRLSVSDPALVVRWDVLKR